MERLYHERQVLFHCAAHSLNAFFGRRVTTCDELVRYARTHPILRNKPHLYVAGTGPVSPDLVSNWAGHTLGWWFRWQGSTQTPKPTKAEVLRILNKRPIHSRFLLFVEGKTPDSRGHGVAVHRLACRRFALVDSLRSKPLLVGRDVPWSRLAGSFHVATRNPPSINQHTDDVVIDLVDSD
jgi:hypothetical protein